jgi:aryl-alcohol dehydrogenase-like predicted oxidoreductase
VSGVSRRAFVKLAIAGGVVAVGSSCTGDREPVVAPLDIERRPFGRTDMRVSVLGFGGAEIGSRKTEQREVNALLNSALDQGLNVIDTAASYWGSEEAIGKAVARRRASYYLFTKVGHVVNGEIVPYQGWSQKEITESIDRSLRRLRTDHVDVVYLHSCDLQTLERGEAIAAVQRAKDAGKTRYIGYSGDNAPARWAVESGLFDALMISVNIVDQQAIDTILPIAAQKGIGVVAKRPIASAVWRFDSMRDTDYDVIY